MLVRSITARRQTNTTCCGIHIRSWPTNCSLFFISFLLSSVHICKRSFGSSINLKATNVSLSEVIMLEAALKDFRRRLLKASKTATSAKAAISFKQCDSQRMERCRLDLCHGWRKSWAVCTSMDEARGTVSTHCDSCHCKLLHFHDYCATKETDFVS